MKGLGAFDRYLLTEDAQRAERWQLEELSRMWFPSRPTVETYKRLRAALATFSAPRSSLPPQPEPRKIAGPRAAS